VLRFDVGADQLNVLRNVGLRGSHPRDAVLRVINQALRHERVLVQVDQVGRALGGEHPHRDAVLLHGHPHLGEDGLALYPYGLGAFQLLLPRLVQFWIKLSIKRKGGDGLVGGITGYQLLAGLQLVDRLLGYRRRRRPHPLVVLLVVAGDDVILRSYRFHRINSIPTDHDS
jgi:hypothetical protein